MHGFNFEHLMKTERNLASRLFLSENLVLDFHLLYPDGGSMELQNELIFYLGSRTEIVWLWFYDSSANLPESTGL